MFPELFRGTLMLATLTLAAAPAQWSGVYPSLATFNNEGECGTGAVKRAEAAADDCRVDQRRRALLAIVGDDDLTLARVEPLAVVAGQG